jgi:DHA2 family multidrug resistance protein-like MFS transporter
LTWGLVAAAVGFGLLTFVDARSGLAALVSGLVIMSLGLAPVFTIGNEMIITAAPPERAGAASAISETSSEFSGALGIAVFGSIGTMLYRATLSTAIPDGLPAEAAAAALATLGGAVTVAHAVGGPAGDKLLGSSQAAFVDALQLTASIGAATVLAASIVSARTLRRTSLSGVVNT